MGIFERWTGQGPCVFTWQLSRLNNAIILFSVEAVIKCEDTIFPWFHIIDVKPAAALVIKSLCPTFLSKVMSICERFPNSGLIFIYERSTFPSTVAFTFCVSLLRCTQLTRPDHNYESYKYRVWLANGRPLLGLLAGRSEKSTAGGSSIRETNKELKWHTHRRCKAIKCGTPRRSVCRIGSTPLLCKTGEVQFWWRGVMRRLQKM